MKAQKLYSKIKGKTTKTKLEEERAEDTGIYLIFSTKSMNVTNSKRQQEASNHTVSTFPHD